MTQELTEQQLKTAKELSTFIIREAKQVFENHEDLTSFGWGQFTGNGGPFDRMHAVYNTRERPDINGNEGPARAWHLRSVVTDFLRQFPSEMLLMAFGNDRSVTIYNDLTHEVHDY